LSSHPFNASVMSSLMSPVSPVTSPTAAGWATKFMFIAFPITFFLLIIPCALEGTLKFGNDDICQIYIYKFKI
jgi:hypothetical protein